MPIARSRRARVAALFGDQKRKPFTAEDVRFTTRDGRVYAIVLAWPASGRVSVTSLASGASQLARPIRSVELLGSDATLNWSQEASGLQVELPGAEPGEFALALRISPR